MIQVKELENLIGKRVLFISQDKTKQIAGKLTFFGYNEHLPSWGFQITLDRTPVTHIDLINDSIIEVTDKTITTKSLL